MKKFLTDNEIMKWNDILKDYVIKPYNSSYSTYPDIVIFKTHGSHFGDGRMQQVTEPNIKYNLTFSVSSNRTESFFEIFEKMIHSKFLTNISTINNRNEESRELIEADTDVLLSKKSEEHEVLKRKFTRYTYKFSGKLSSIMAYVSCLTDAINYFQMVWGYDEEGNEHCLLKYPIGSIVSKSKDKSKDYLVLEYDFSKNTNDIFKIRYYACEMLNTDSSIIQYGESMLCDEKELCFSRNNRIDDILN